MNGIQISADEKVLLDCRTHWKNYVLPFTAAGICIVFLLLRLCSYGSPLWVDFKASFSVDVDYRIVSLVECLVAASLAVRFVCGGFHHFFVRYIITDQRLIHHAGFLSTRTTELWLCYCSNLILEQSMWGKILGYGDFRLRAGGVDMFFDDVPHPVQFRRVLSLAIEAAEAVHVSRYYEAAENNNGI